MVGVTAVVHLQHLISALNPLRALTMTQADLQNAVKLRHGTLEVGWLPSPNSASTSASAAATVQFASAEFLLLDICS